MRVFQIWALYLLVLCQEISTRIFDRMFTVDFQKYTYVCLYKVQYVIQCIDVNAVCFTHSNCNPIRSICSGEFQRKRLIKILNVVPPRTSTFEKIKLGRNEAKHLPKASLYLV